MKKLFLLICLSITTIGWLSAQERYLDEVFTDVNVESDVVYGNNATILALAQAGQAIPQDLVCDVYTPDGDTETNRPAVIVLHTGNFLPPTFNGGCGGTIDDADVVELCTRLAKMGYVAIAADYRLGWDPTNMDQAIRVFTIINAAYRGVQDSRTAVKYLRNDALNGNNQYGIDPDKIAMWGFGTGAYISYGSASLNAVTDTYIPEFLFSLNPFIPMVAEAINGDLNADQVGIAPANYPPFPEGDTLCYPNLPGVDASFKLAIQMGGALGDTSWVTAGDVPMISFHVPSDPFAPCVEGVLSVPPPVNLPVVEVNGACLTLPTAVDLGINDIFDVDFIDPISAVAAESDRGDDNPGLFLFPSGDPEESAPWNFAYSAEPYGVMGSDCPTDQVSAQTYMDTVMAYVAPRACLALGLGCNLEGITNTNEILEEEFALTLAPNPASSIVNIRAEENIENIYIFDITGKMVRMYNSVNSQTFELHKKQIGTGTYVAQIYFKEGFVSKKVIFE